MRSRRASAYQIPRHAIGQAHELARRHRDQSAHAEPDEPLGVEEPDAEQEERDRERHRMDRCCRTRRRPRIREVADREKRCRRLGPEVAPAEPEDGQARRARRPPTCANPSASGEGQTSHSGASSARNGSTCAASRTICSPVAPSVISSGRPFAVLQTACTMFPRSNRPSRKFVVAAPGRRRTARRSTRRSRPTRQVPRRARVRGRARGSTGRCARPRGPRSGCSCFCRDGEGRDSSRPLATVRVSLARPGRRSARPRRASTPSGTAIGCPLPGVNTMRATGQNHKSSRRGRASATTTRSSTK